MTDRRHQPHRHAGAAAGEDQPYECTYCETTFRDWPGDCSDCGQVVVRVVDPGPLPDR